MDNKTQKYSNFSNLKYIMKMLFRADKGTVLYTLYKNSSEEIFYVFFGVYLTKYIYNCIEKRTPYNNLLILVSIACLMHVGVHFVSAGHAYYLKLHTPKIYRYIFNKVIEKSTEMELNKFEDPKFYDKFTRALDECMDRGMEILDSIGCFIGHSSAAFLASLVLITVDPILILFLILPVIASLYFGKKCGENSYEMDIEATRDKRQAAYIKRVFYEKKYAGEIRLYPIKNILLKTHKKNYENIYKTNVKYRQKETIYETAAGVSNIVFAIFGSYIYIAFVLKLGFKDGVGAYVAMISALEFISSELKDSIIKGINIQKSGTFINNLREFLEYEKEEKEYDEKIDYTLGDIEFKNVSFTYRGAKKPVIENFSLKIHKGEKVALVGYNGAGKTTLVKLLMGLYEVTEGEILVNGININKFNPKEYHEHFGTVFQDLQIFALPLSENVIMKSNLTDNDRALVENSLKKAQLINNIDELKKGIDTVVTKEFDEEGMVCSGGQAQKIAIARIFAKNPDIVILDEPSSALDPIAEYNMYKNMMESCCNKTVIFISHRLSSARIADSVYLLKNGKIVESGSHDKLMRQDGEYSRMFKLQAKNYQNKSMAEEEVAVNEAE